MYSQKNRKLHKRRTDGRTDRRRVRQQSVVFSKKNTKKQMHARRTSIFCYVRMYSENSARLNKTKIEWKGIIFRSSCCF